MTAKFIRVQDSVYTEPDRADAEAHARADGFAGVDVWGWWVPANGNIAAAQTGWIALDYDE